MPEHTDTAAYLKVGITSNLFMAYKAFFSLDSVKVIRSDGEDGEYSFRVYYKNDVYAFVHTPDNVGDGSEWRPFSFSSYQIGPFSDNEKFTLKLESVEYDGGLRLGDGNAMVEKSFGFNDQGLHNIYMKDSDDNEVEFRITTSMQYIDSGGIGGNQSTPLNTESGLMGVMLYEDWHYNKVALNNLNFLSRPRKQRFTVGDYDLPYQPTSTGGQWGGHTLVLGVRPDTLSSLKIGTGYYIELFDELGKNGNKITISENTPEIPSLWNDKVKSISIKWQQQPHL